MYKKDGGSNKAGETLLNAHGTFEKRLKALYASSEERFEQKLQSNTRALRMSENGVKYLAERLLRELERFKTRYQVDVTIT
jgi:hypothetical protein